MSSSKKCEQLRLMEQQKYPINSCSDLKPEKVKPVNAIEKPEFIYQTSPPISENHSKFLTPPHRKLAVTRESRLEHFWWHEFYAEYLRSYHRSIQPHPIPKTEYTENYEKEILSTYQDQEAMANKYPVYNSTAITMYNLTGDKSCTFRKKYSITCPVHLSDEQFG